MPYNANQLDKNILIEKETTTTNTVGTPTEGYATLKETKAYFRVLTGNSEYGDEGTLPYTRVEFVMRYDSRINYKCRILYDSQYYEINHLETIDRNAFIKARCVVWEAETAN